MKQFRSSAMGLITWGAGRRILVAALLSMTLWALFFWATTTPGGL